MKIRPVGAEMFHAGGRTDMMKLIVVTRNLANAPKNGYILKFVRSISYFLSVLLHRNSRSLLQNVLTGFGAHPVSSRG
jgi:hypothetical protein